MSQTISFYLGDNLHEIFRDAYWFEERKEWALETLDCIHGITEEQKMAIINGDAKLVPIEDGKRLQLVYEEDKKFKLRLWEHQEWRKENYFNFAGHWVTKKETMEYVNFVVKQYRLVLRCPQMFAMEPMVMLRMEDIRTGLHEGLMFQAGFAERSGSDYLDFATALDKLVDQIETIHKYGPPLTYTIGELKEELDKKYGEFGRKRTVSKFEDDDSVDEEEIE